MTVASPPGSWNSGLQIQNRESKIQVMAISNHPGGGLRPASEQYRTKVDIATDQLREWILSGDLHYGERLDQARLAATLDVSRMPLRQALLRLADEGLIEAPPHRSAVVTRLSTTELEDLYQARRAMEGVLAELGSQRRDESCVRAMERGLREQEKAVAKGDYDGGWSWTGSFTSSSTGRRLSRARMRSRLSSAARPTATSAITPRTARAPPPQ